MVGLGVRVGARVGVLDTFRARAVAVVLARAVAVVATPGRMVGVGVALRERGVTVAAVPSGASCTTASLAYPRDEVATTPVGTALAQTRSTTTAVPSSTISRIGHPLRS